MKINLILPGARSSGGVRVAFEYMNALVEKDMMWSAMSLQAART